MVKKHRDEDEESEEPEDSEPYEEEVIEEESEESEEFAPQRKKKPGKAGAKKEEAKAPAKKEEAKPARKKCGQDPDPDEDDQPSEEEKAPAKRQRGKAAEESAEPKKKREKAPKPVKEKRVTKREVNKAKEEAVMKQYAEAEAKVKSFEDVTAHIDSILGDTSSINPYKNLLKKTSGTRELSRKVIAYIFNKAAGHPDLYPWAEELVQATQQALFEPRKIVHDPMFFPSLESEAKVVHYLNSATTTLDICVFSITYNVLGDAIIEAHKRGVKVRVISDDEQAKNPGADIERLQQAGIPLKIDLDPKAHMHNKFVLIDKQTLLTGSFNWTKQAALKNNENFMATNDEYLIEKYGEEYERLWEKFIVPGTAPPHPPKPQASPQPLAEKPVEEAPDQPKPGEGETDPDEMLSG